MQCVFLVASREHAYQKRLRLVEPVFDDFAFGSAAAVDYRARSV